MWRYSPRIDVRGPLVRSKAVVAVGEIKKKGEPGGSPFFFFRMPPFMSKTSTTARTAKAVCKRLSKF
jgi:hypothetical protein